MVKGVLSVTGSVEGLEDHMARERVRRELGQALWEDLLGVVISNRAVEDYDATFETICHAASTWIRAAASASTATRL